MKTLNADIQRKSNAFRGDFRDWKMEIMKRQQTNHIMHQTYTDEHVTAKSAEMSRRKKDVVFEDCNFIRCTFKNIIFEAGFHNCNFIECVFEEFSVGSQENTTAYEFVHYRGFFNCEFTRCRFARTTTCKFTSITNCYFKECAFNEVVHVLFLNGARIKCTNKKNRKHISSFFESEKPYMTGNPVLPQNEIVGYKYAHASLKGHRRSETSLANMVMVKLLIPADSIRFCPDLTKTSLQRLVSGSWDKCRCEKAKVIEITKLTNATRDDIVKNLENYDILSPLTCGPDLINYEVGKEVKPHWFDMNPLTECTGGIHFFLDAGTAVSFARHAIAIS